MTEIEYKSLKQGDAVSYGPYSKVFYDRTTTQRADGTSYGEPHVVMVDRKGDEKAVFERLFIKNAKIIQGA